MTEFKWPCDRRDAHEPHVVVWRQRAHEGTPFAITETGTYDCPGVKAHPATQIGGNYISERKD